jgi:arylsulfatase A-like enzyme
MFTIAGSTVTAPPDRLSPSGMKTALFLALALAVTGALAAPKPNILLIVSDDQGYPDLGCIGAKPMLTPHLDRLAAEGVRATSFYVTAPACTPSRGSILTGRYPRRNGLYEMVRNDLVNYGHLYTPTEYAVSPEMTLGLDPREITIGNVLQRAGYRTGVVGKWDMGQARRYLPLQRGFDFFYGHGNNGIDYYTHERYGIHSMFRGNERTEADKGVYATDLFKREALRFIGESGKRPWFLYLAFNAPHSGSTFAPEPPDSTSAGRVARRPPGVGVQAPEQYTALFRDKVKDEKLARYYGAVTCMDDAIGEVLALLKERGEERNTLVIFFSDNGGSGNGGNAPLRGGKGTLFEGGLRVPFIAWWPGRLPAGRVCDDFLTTLELLPTIAAATGAKPARNVKLDGFDMLPVLRGDKPSPRTEMFWEWREQRAARVGKWKWLESPKGGGSLFDLSADLGEQRDLSGEQPEMLRQIQSRFAAWRVQIDAAEPRGPFRDY